MCESQESTLRLLSRSEALAVFTGDEKRLDHFGVDEVAVELVELAEPEIVPVRAPHHELFRKLSMGEPRPQLSLSLTKKPRSSEQGFLVFLVVYLVL